MKKNTAVPPAKSENANRLDREKKIVRTGLIGIACNIVLAAVKGAIGLAAHSSAIVTDALNNLTDLLSSVITIIGVKLAGRKPDKKHPLGYGRVEYLSALLIGSAILSVGLSAVIDAVQSILEGSTPEFSIPSVIILAVAVLVKIILGFYTQKVGRSVDSTSLIASGKEALNDAMLTSAALAGVLINLLFGIQLDSWLALFFSLFIVKNGWDTIRTTIEDLLGRRAEHDVSRKIKKLAVSEPGVLGAADLFIENYGPGRQIGFLHVEVSETMTISEFDELSRKLYKKIYDACKIPMTIGAYALPVPGSDAWKNLQKVRSYVESHQDVLSMHGYHENEKTKEIWFDIVYSFDVKDRQQLRTELEQGVSEIVPGYTVHIILDADLSD